MRNRTYIGAVFMAAITLATQAYAQNPCPTCPPCTNCVPVTNTFVTPEYDPSALLVRVASISDDGTLLMTNSGWTLDTNSLLVYGANNWSNSSAASSLTYLLAVTNTSLSNVYALQYSGSLTDPFTNVVQFVGPTNGSEYTTSLLMANANDGFWRVTKLDGFVIYCPPLFFTGQSAGDLNACPGPYCGYGNYVKTIADGWGWYQDTNNATVFTATDPLRTNTHVLALSDYGANYCDIHTVSIPLDTHFNVRYRFTVYFRTNSSVFPTNQVYPLWLRGWKP